MAGLAGQCTRAVADPENQPGGAAELGLRQGPVAGIPFVGGFPHAWLSEVHDDDRRE